MNNLHNSQCMFRTCAASACSKPVNNLRQVNACLGHVTLFGSTCSKSVNNTRQVNACLGHVTLFGSTCPESVNNSRQVNAGLELCDSSDNRLIIVSDIRSNPVNNRT